MTGQRGGKNKMIKFKTEKVTQLRFSCLKVRKKVGEYIGNKCTGAVWKGDKHIKNIESDKIVMWQ